MSPDTNVQKTFTNIKQNIFKELVPLVLPLLKKHIRLGRTHWYCGPFRRFINTRFFLKSIKNEWTEAIKKNSKYYINA